MNERIDSFAPVADGDSRVLILGTMPSVASLADGFYYGHPRNAFWPIMARAFGAPPPRSVGEKIDLLTKNRVALWDVVDSCVREGSLDANIRDELPNDFGWFFRRYPGIRAVLLNGGTARRLFLRHSGGAQGDRPVRMMPSTSPAYTLPFEQKYAAWKAGLESALGGGADLKP